MVVYKDSYFQFVFSFFFVMFIVWDKTNTVVHLWGIDFFTEVVTLIIKIYLEIKYWFFNKWTKIEIYISVTKTIIGFLKTRNDF